MRLAFANFPVDPFTGKQTPSPTVPMETVLLFTTTRLLVSWSGVFIALIYASFPLLSTVVYFYFLVAPPGVRYRIQAFIYLLARNA